MAAAAMFTVGLAVLVIAMGAALVIAAWFARRQRPTLAERLLRDHELCVAEAAEQWLRAYDRSTSARRSHDKY
jgi:hypothetical protein